MQIVDPSVHQRSVPNIVFSPTNQWTEDGGKEYVMIENLETFEPFFLSMATVENQWLFCSSYGSLSAGRQSPDTALFPYYTVDKIIGNWNTTGPWTALITEGTLWNPFRPSIALLTPTHRRLMKSVLGDELVFDEFHEELGLRLTYRWQFSNRFGFVRKVRLSNEGSQTRDVRWVDGLDNLLPSGVSSRMQLEYSCLADAYKVSELECEGALMIHRLAAGITDEPIPLENLLATTVWTHGLGEGPTFQVRRDAEDFLRGGSAHAPAVVRAKRGAMLLGREQILEPGEQVEWMMVAEIEQDQVAIGELRKRLLDPEQLIAEVEEDIRQGSERLRDMVAKVDGFQQTADRDTALYHYNNSLCNIMRGGVPENGYELKREQFLSYLELHNRPLKERHASWLGALPEKLQREELLARVAETGDLDLSRLVEEYLPLILSRRHGDPSRPWNRFDIRLRDESGAPIQHFEGNWRDIFQNWEALAWSFPDYLSGFIAKFLNASTIDGFNPYRLTSEGVDWEVPDENDPWASIGYWGDHQIIYLLKLLELEHQVFPDHLADRFNVLGYVFVDVPYRLKGWKQTLQNPRDTVDFDHEHHARLMKLKAEMGADGVLLCDDEGRRVKVSLMEKLLLPAVTKMANLVPGGGIWMNTQRPEWNDANNALAGCGLSLVTAAYLHRYLKFLADRVEQYTGDEFLISPALRGLLEILNDQLSEGVWHDEQQPSGNERFEMVKVAGLALEKYRSQVYQGGGGQPAPVAQQTILAFLKNGQRALEATLRQNRRSDGLWHSYNILNIEPDAETLDIEHLTVMLEGQVAILSAGILEPNEALELLEALPSSDLYTDRHQTYLLYPDRETTRFLDANCVDEEKVLSVATLSAMVERGDSRIVKADPNGGFRFHSSLTNADALAAKLDEIATEWGDLQDRQEIETLYESVFNHRSFTGRSGTMFGYEGLGCVYWHMVSKLMLAAQEITHQAIQEGASHEVIQRLTVAYFSIQSGLGYRKSPEQYGAFPAEPYSHSPAHAGAQQPGLTGQVKEGILCRFGELGVFFEGGCLMFRPYLLREAEFAGPPVSFSVAGTSVVYRRCQGIDQVKAVVHFQDGTEKPMDDAVLDQEMTLEITRQTGHITKIEVDIPSHWLVS